MLRAPPSHSRMPSVQRGQLIFDPSCYGFMRAMSDKQAAELFGGESSSEEEDSSEESSGEQENQQPAATVEGGEGVAHGVEVGEESSSSSSSGESGSEGEESETNEVGVVSEPQQQESTPQPVSGTSDALAKAQNLFGETSSSSSSDSEDGDGVIGMGGGSEGEEEEGEGVMGEGGERDSSPAESELKSNATAPSANQAVQSDDEMMDSANRVGDESMQSEDGTSQSEDRPSQTVEGLFGDAADLSSSDSEEDGGKVGGEEGREESEVVRMLEGNEGEAETEVPRINVEIPRCSANLGSDQYFVKLPNFLSVETRPFDPALFEDEVEDESEILDEEGRARLKLKVENTIRWRYSQDESGNEVRESNARVVRWSDGTMSLYLGSEIFDIHRQPLQGEFSHLFVRQGTGLQGQAVFQSKLTFRPHSTDSQTHRKMTLSIADRFSKAQKIRVLPAVGKDPESQKKEKIKKEEERLRAAVRRENQQKRVRERHAQRGLTANYIEPDREDDDDDEGASVAAIKSSYRNRLSEMRGGRGGGVWGGAESEGETSEEGEEEEGEERLMRAKTDDGALSRKRRMEQPEESSHRKQPHRRLLHSDDSEDSD